MDTDDVLIGRRIATTSTDVSQAFIVACLEPRVNLAAAPAVAREL